jgi:drug/metabolite transporter (DMT)-like permease
MRSSASTRAIGGATADGRRRQPDRRAQLDGVSPRTLGVTLCLVSGVSFGLAAVIARRTFTAGFDVPSLLTGRFTVAAAVFWIIALRRIRTGRVRRPSRRSLAVAVGLGAIGYALQSAFYFGALTRLNASVLAQLLYTYPALVLVIALVLRRESPERRKVAALACSALGLALLLNGGSGAGAMPLVGVLMALGAAGTYALYITVAATLPADFDVYLLSAVVCSAAAVSCAGYSGVTGALHGPADPAGWLWLLLFALVPTVVAIVTFLAGLRRVGGPVAAILSCTEPVVTAGSAALVYGERLTPTQLAGAVAVLSAVVVLQLRRRPGTSVPVNPVPAESAPVAQL